MKLLSLPILLFLSVLFSLNANALPQKSGYMTEEKMASKAGNELSSSPKLLVIKFHADWCGSCKALGPVLTDLTNKLDGKPVLFTELDFTNQSKKHQALLLASALGVDKIVAKNPGTGFLLVVDSKTKKVKATLNKKHSVKEMAEIITGLL